ncbi:carbamoyltransferase [Polyangium aurulentum]|uniref:carbamoyltransferase family protein n=1 Tax=Polyangium aurulentum TaxID=2567896 RepID=UPI00146E6423|nr:carbamoyltransferase N-terminal domain-containing protein [Polyangium aurulentum]UQA57317.1 hypothetical protein E8A73_039470 [Polyangium aurulentum]
MAAVLGVSGLYHDAAAALVVDGRIAAAVQEERLSRIKNDPRLPVRAMRSCLATAGLEPGDLDRIVFYEQPFVRLERVMVSLLRAWPRSIRQFPRALASMLSDKIWALDRIAEELCVPRARVVAAEHHRSHAASAFFASPFERAAVLTVDGVGEEATTVLWHGQGKELRAGERIDFPHSLGLLYAAITAWLGFEVNEGEYKVMGLAAHGEPRLLAEFERLVRLDPGGGFSLGLEYFAFESDTEIGFGPRLVSLLGPPRPPGKPFRLGAGGEDRYYADVAATLQRVTEEALLGLARRALRTTGEEDLCLAGGVALNAVANRRLLAESGARRVFVQPAAGDAGGALGAALMGAIELGDPRPPPLASAALGPALDPGEAAALAGHLGLAPERVSDPAERAAELLLEGAIVAFAEGRCELGPRALGQRSILALPDRRAVRDRINRAVKRREPFRPFAPSALADRAGAWFDGAPNDMTPFMTTVCPVRPEAQSSLAAVTHIDGTARLQTVTAASAPALFEVLSALERRGARPVVLNTSLNGPGEPIALGAADAVAFYAAHPVDALVAGDVVLRRRR